MESGLAQHARRARARGEKWRLGSGSKPKLSVGSELDKHQALRIASPNLHTDEKERNRRDWRVSESWAMYTGDVYYATGSGSSSGRAQPLDDAAGLQLDPDTSSHLSSHMQATLEDVYEVRKSLIAATTQKLAILSRGRRPRHARPPPTPTRTPPLYSPLFALPPRSTLLSPSHPLTLGHLLPPQPTTRGHSYSVPGNVRSKIVVHQPSSPSLLFAFHEPALHSGLPSFVLP